MSTALLTLASQSTSRAEFCTATLIELAGGYQNAADILVHALDKQGTLRPGTGRCLDALTGGWKNASIARPIVAALAPLIKHSDQDVALFAIQRLGLSGHSAVVPRLTDHFRSELPVACRRATITALALIADRGTRALFSEGLKDADGFVQRTCAIALGRLRDSTAVPALRRLVEGDNSPETRAVGQMALRSLGFP